MSNHTESLKEVGQSIPRKESRYKVNGQTEYTHHVKLPGMLIGKIFRSTVAHGKIISIDTSQAKSYPGVFAVYTSEDIKTIIPDPYYGPAFLDQLLMDI